MLHQLGKRACSGIHWGAPGYEAVQSRGATSHTIGSDTRRIRWNKNYRRLGILTLATLVAALPPTLALSEV